MSDRRLSRDKEKYSMSEAESGGDIIAGNYEKLSPSALKNVLIWKPENEEEFLKALDQKMRNGRLIGLELLQFVETPEEEKKIHNRADEAIPEILFESRGYHRKYPLLALSFSLNALHNYQNSFHQYLPDLYPRTVSDPRIDLMKLESLVRRVGDYYAGRIGFPEKRQINFFVRQTIIPQSSMEKFLNLAWELYNGLFFRELPEEEDKTNQLLNAFFSSVRSGLKAGKKYLFTSQIVTVQDLMTHPSWNTDLMEYMKIVLTWIDAYYWNDKRASGTGKESLPYPASLRSYFENWHPQEKTLIRQRQTGTRTKRSRIWKTTYELDGKQIRLRLPAVQVPENTRKDQITMTITAEKIGVVHRLSAQLYLYEGFCMTRQVLFPIPPAEVFEDIRFEVRIGSHVLLDTGQSLYRRILLFDGQGREITGRFPETGSIMAAFPSGMPVENLTLCFRSGPVVFGSMDISAEKAARIGPMVFGTQQTVPDRIYGTSLKGIHAAIGSRKIPVFAKVKSIAMSLKAAAEQQETSADRVLKGFVFTLNHRPVHPAVASLEKTDGWSREDGPFSLWSFKADISKLLQPGLNVLQVHNDVLFSRKKKMTFILDPDFDIGSSMEEGSWMLTSGWIGKTGADGDCCRTGNLNPEGEHLISLEVLHPMVEGSLKLWIEPDSPWFRVDKRPWCPLTEPLMLSELDPYSKMEFCGIHPRRIILEQNPGKQAELSSESSRPAMQEIAFTDRNGLVQIETGQIQQAGRNADALQMKISGRLSWNSLQNQEQEIPLQILCRTVLKTMPETGVDPETDLCWIAFEALGPDPLVLSISRSKDCFMENDAGWLNDEAEDEDRILYWIDGLEGKVRLELENVPIGEPVRVVISTGDPDDLFSEQEVRVLYDQILTFWRSDQRVNFILVEWPAADFRSRSSFHWRNRAARGLTCRSSGFNNLAAADLKYKADAFSWKRTITGYWSYKGIQTISAYHLQKEPVYQREMMRFLMAGWQAEAKLQEKRQAQLKQEAEKMQQQQRTEEEQRRNTALYNERMTQYEQMRKKRYVNLIMYRFKGWLQIAANSLQKGELLWPHLYRLQDEPEMIRILHDKTDKLLCSFADGANILSRPGSLTALLSFSLLAYQNEDSLQTEFWQTYPKCHRKIKDRTKKDLRRRFIAQVRQNTDLQSELRMLEDESYIQIQSMVPPYRIPLTIDALYRFYFNQLGCMIPSHITVILKGLLSGTSSEKNGLLRQMGRNLEILFSHPLLREKGLSWIEECLKIIDSQFHIGTYTSEYPMLENEVKEWFLRNRGRISADRTEAWENQHFQQLQKLPVYALEENRLILKLPAVLVPESDLYHKIYAELFSKTGTYRLHPAVQKENNQLYIPSLKLTLPLNPDLKTMVYQLRDSARICFSTGSFLYRNFFFLNQKGREVKEPFGLQGKYQVLFPSGADLWGVLKVREFSSGWMTGVANFGRYKYIRIGKTVMSSYKKKAPVFNGSEIENLLISDGRRQVRCYKKIGDLDFYTNTLDTSYALRINNRQFQLQESRFRWITEPEYAGYRSKIPLTEISRTGYNKLQIIDMQSSSVLYETEFFYDSSFKFYVDSSLTIKGETKQFWRLQSSCLIDADSVKNKETFSYKMLGPFESGVQEIELAIPGPAVLSPLKAKIKISLKNK